MTVAEATKLGLIKATEELLLQRGIGGVEFCQMRSCNAWMHSIMLIWAAVVLAAMTGVGLGLTRAGYHIISYVSNLGLLVSKRAYSAPRWG